MIPTSGGITISSVSAIPLLLLLLLLIHKCSLVFLYLPLEVQCWPSEPSLKLKLACEIISNAITLCSMSLSAAMLSSLPLTELGIWVFGPPSISLTRREQCNCHSTDLLLHRLTPIYLHRLTPVSRPRPFTYMSWASTKVWSLPNENLKRGDEATRWSAQMRL